MAQKFIYPKKFIRDHLRQELRLDGRQHDMYRPVGINSGSLSKSLGSAIVRVGKCSIVCGVRGELAKPQAETPRNGYVIPILDLSFLPHGNTSSFETKEISDTITSSIFEILTSSDFINLEDLCIHKGKLVWLLHCNLIFLEQDGCVFDASLLACFASLKDLRLPKIVYNESNNKVRILSGSMNLRIKWPLVVSTHVLLENFLLTDPNFEEECLSNAVIHIGISNRKLKLIKKSGGKGISRSQLDLCLAQAIEREVEISKLFNLVKCGI